MRGLCGLPAARCALIRRLPPQLIRSLAGSSETRKQAGAWLRYSPDLALAARRLPEFLLLRARRRGGCKRLVETPDPPPSPPASSTPSTAGRVRMAPVSPSCPRCASRSARGWFGAQEKLPGRAGAGAGAREDSCDVFPAATPRRAGLQPPPSLLLFPSLPPSPMAPPTPFVLIL